MEHSPVHLKVSNTNIIEKYTSVNKATQTNKVTTKKNTPANNTQKPMELFEINASLHQKSEAELLQFEEDTYKSELDDEPEEFEDNYHENIYYNIDGNHLNTSDEDNIY
jgi:hypothetical protein